MIIGNLTYDKTRDLYTGELTTLSVGIRKVVFQPNKATGDKAPAYRVVSQSKTGEVEFGAAWKKRSEEGREYLSVRLDDPTLGQPFNCALVASNDSTEKLILVWSRDNRKAKAA
jgi:uncharacterized protein (DUF736 family)